jgi:ABC-type sugar transport system substrate-binding protein
MRRMSLGVLALIAALGCNPSGSGSGKQQFYLVTHGRSTDSGFWGSVFRPAEEKAAELGVELIPLHPATETTGEALNVLVDQALAAKPAGIIATVWGEGMESRIRAANAAKIPVVTINVFPDSKVYGRPGNGTRAELLMYVGQQDYDAALTGTRALICKAGANELLDGSKCATKTVEEAFAAVKAKGPVVASCLLFEQTPGVLARCAAMSTVLTALDPTLTVTKVEWDGTKTGEGETAIRAYFNQTAVKAATTALVLATGEIAVAPYAASDLGTAVESKVKMMAFDLGGPVCGMLGNGRLTFAIGQGEKDQATQSLVYLHHYLKEGKLPEPGKTPAGGSDPRWARSDDGLPWFKTGPAIVEKCP